MKNMIKIGFLSLFLLLSLTPKAQVLISLLFGEKLNTPKIEFGMVGGLNRSYLNNYNNSEGKNYFNLGFYFHVNISQVVLHPPPFGNSYGKSQHCRCNFLTIKIFRNKISSVCFFIIHRLKARNRVFCIGVTNRQDYRFPLIIGF